MIDFKLLPVDTVVDVKMLNSSPDYHHNPMPFYFSGVVDQDCGVGVFPSGGTSLTHRSPNIKDNLFYFMKFRISDKNPWLPWFGGDCPVPPNCKVQVVFRGNSWLVGSPESINARRADAFNWSHKHCLFNNNIIAYRMLESPWQTIDGVCNE